MKTAEMIRQMVDGIFAERVFHAVLTAHDSLPDEAACQKDLTAAHDALNVNGISSGLETLC